jgi:hypothetical protein
VLFSSLGAFADPQQAANMVSYVASRDPSDWEMASVSPPVTVSPIVTYPNAFEGFSDDLAFTVMSKFDPPLTPDAQAHTINLYRRSSDGSYVLLTPSGPTDQTALQAKAYRPYFAGGSSDFTHIIFESTFALTPNATPGAINLYEWVAGQTRLVGILPNGSAAVGSAAGPLGGSSFPGATGQAYTQNTISADGSRIFWTDLSDNQLYVRINGSTTAHVSGSHRTNDSGPGGSDPNGPQPATYVGATPSGSTVFFTSAEKLTNDSTASASAVPVEEDLYAYDVASGALADLSVDQNPAESADVKGLVGASDDGSYVYFVATGGLAAGAVVGQPNLYLWHAGAVRYVTTLDSSPVGDERNWALVTSAGPKTSRVTSDGKTLLIWSNLRLTTYNNGGHTEFYRYEASDSTLRCVSCNLSEANATGDATMVPPLGSAVGGSLQPFLTRILSSDGRRVFFNSQESLVPGDTNGKVDVYEWEADGTGGCRQDAGCVSLISSGKSASDAYFADASASGDDVFFATRERLVASDVDSNVDLYDARVGGGFADVTPAQPCSGDDCQGVGTSSGASPSAASETVFGLGNAQSGSKRAVALSVAAISAKARQSFAMTGRLTLTVRVGAGGMVRAVAVSRIAGRASTVAHAARHVSRSGAVHLMLTLSRSARRQLALGRRLKVTITVTFPGARTRTATLTLIRHKGHR